MLKNLQLVLFLTMVPILQLDLCGWSLALVQSTIHIKMAFNKQKHPNQPKASSVHVTGAVSMFNPLYQNKLISLIKTILSLLQRRCPVVSSPNICLICLNIVKLKHNICPSGTYQGLYVSLAPPYHCPISPAVEGWTHHSCTPRGWT